MSCTVYWIYTARRDVLIFFWFLQFTFTDDLHTSIQRAEVCQSDSMCERIAWIVRQIKLETAESTLHCNVSVKISFCFCTLSGRSNVIEKLEALELEHAERMEVEERCSGVRQGRSEMRRFQREVMYTNPNPQCSYSQTLWWFYSRHCHHALPGDAASSRELSMWMWRTLGIPRNSAFKVL